MSAETDFRAVLAGFAGLTALVGQAIAQNAVPPKTAAPYVVFTSEHQPSRALGNTLLGERVTFNVACWGKTPASADAVADQVEAALAAQGIQPEARAGEFDPETLLDCTQLVFDWWIV